MKKLIQLFCLQNFTKAASFKEARFLFDAPPAPEGEPPAPPATEPTTPAAPEGDAAVQEYKKKAFDNVDPNPDWSNVTGGTIGEWKNLSTSTEHTDQFKTKVAGYIKETKDFYDKVAKDQITEEEKKQFATALKKLNEKAEEVKKNAELDKQKKGLKDLESKVTETETSFKASLTKDKESYADGLIANIVFPNDKLKAAAKANIIKSLAGVEKEPLAEMKSAKDKIASALKSDKVEDVQTAITELNSTVSEFKATLAEHLGVLDNQSSDKCPNGKKCIEDEKEYVDKLKFVFDEAKRAEIFNKEGAGENCTKQMAKWEKVFGKWISTGPLPGPADLVAQVKEAENDICLGHIVDQLKDDKDFADKLKKLKLSVSVESLRKLFQTYASGESKGKENIRNAAQLLLSKIASLNIEGVVEGGADAQAYKITDSQKGRYDEMAKAAIRLQNSPLWGSSEVGRYHDQIRAFVGTDDKLAFLKDPAHQSEFTRAGGVLNVILSFERLEDISGQKGTASSLLDSDNIKFKLTTQTDAIGAQYRNSGVRFARKGSLTNAVGAVPRGTTSTDTPTTPTTTPSGTPVGPTGQPGTTPGETAPAAPQPGVVAPTPATGEAVPTAPTPTPEVVPATPSNMQAIPVEGEELPTVNGDDTYKKEGGKFYYKQADGEFKEVDQETLNILRGINSPSDEYVKKIVTKKYSFLDPTLVTGSSYGDYTLTIYFKKGEQEISVGYNILEQNWTESISTDVSNFLRPGITQEEIADLGPTVVITTPPEGIHLADPVTLNDISALLDASGNLKNANTINTFALYFTKIDASNLGPNNLAISPGTLIALMKEINLDDNFDKLKLYFEDDDVKTLKFILDNHPEISLATIKDKVGDDPASEIFKLFAKKFTTNTQWQRELKDAPDEGLTKNIIRSLVKQNIAVPTGLLQHLTDIDDLQETIDGQTKFSPEMQAKLAELVTKAVAEKATLPKEFNTLVDAIWPEKDKMPVQIRAQYEFHNFKDDTKLNDLLATIPAGQESEFLKSFIALTAADTTILVDFNPRMFELLKSIASSSPKASALLTTLIRDNLKTLEGSDTESFGKAFAELKVQYAKILDKNTSPEIKWAILEIIRDGALSTDTAYNDHKKLLAGSPEAFDRIIKKAAFDTAYQFSQKGDNSILVNEQVPNDATPDQKAYFDALANQNSDTSKALLEHIKAGKYTPAQLESIARLYLNDADRDMASTDDDIAMLIAMGLEGRAEAYILNAYKDSSTKIANIHLIKLKKYQSKAKEMLEDAYRSLIGTDGTMVGSKEGALNVIEACLEHGIDQVIATDGASTTPISIDDEGILVQLTQDTDTDIQNKARYIKAKYELDQCTSTGQRKELCESGELLAETAAHLEKETPVKGDYDFAAQVIANSPGLETLDTIEKKTAYVKVLYKLVSQDEPQKAHEEAFIKISPDLIDQINDADITAKYNALKDKTALEHPDLTTPEGQKAYIEAVTAEGSSPTADQLKTAAKYADKDQLTTIIGKTEDANIKVQIYLAAFAGNLKGDKVTTLLGAYESAKGQTKNLGVLTLKTLWNTLSANGHDNEAFDIMYKSPWTVFSADEITNFLTAKKITAIIDSADLSVIIDEGNNEDKIKARFAKLITGPNVELLKSMPITYRAKFYKILTKGATSEQIGKIKEVLDMNEETAEANVDHTYKWNPPTLTVTFVNADATTQDESFTLRHAPYFNPVAKNDGNDKYLDLGGEGLNYVEFDPHSQKFEFSLSDEMKKDYNVVKTDSQISTIAKRTVYRLKGNIIQITPKDTIVPIAGGIDVNNPATFTKFKDIGGANEVEVTASGVVLDADLATIHSYKEGCIKKETEGYSVFIGGGWEAVKKID